MSNEKPSARVSRRDFMNFVLAFTGSVIGVGVGIPLIGYFLGPALKKETSDVWLPAGPLKNYPKEKPTLFSFTRTKKHGWEKTVESFGVYVIRKSDTEAEVLSNICTHLGCRVKWHQDVGQYICPCHGAHYTKEGKVISGPAPRPLDRFETKVEKGVLYIHFVEKE